MNAFVYKYDLTSFMLYFQKQEINSHKSVTLRLRVTGWRV